MPSRKLDPLILEKMYMFIKQSARTQGTSPSLVEIRIAMNFRSNGRVERYLDQLDEQGLIVYSTTKHRAIKLVENNELVETTAQSEDAEAIRQPSNIRVEGTIAAGLPIEKFSDTEQKLYASSELIREDTYALIVKGQSMIDEHICNGDYIILRRQHIYENGDIIVATHLLDGLEGSATLKHFFLDERQNLVYLKPANSKFEPITISVSEWEQEWEIQGKLLAVLRF